MRIRTAVVWFVSSLILVGCSGVPKPSVSDSGGFYGGDNAPSDKHDFDTIADAIPKHEPLSRTGNKPYTALGQSFTPLKSSKGYVKTGIASWYGTKFHGRRTSSGETYDMWAMTAAHPTLPLPTYVEVTHLESGKKIVVKVNDRGPFLHNRIIDLSYVAAHKLGIADRGTGKVLVKAIDPGDNGSRIANNRALNDKVKFNQAVTGTLGKSAVVPSYFIQVGAYSEISNAQSMRQRLHQQGHAVYPLTELGYEEQRPYRVQVGPFPTIDNALQVKHSLEQLLGQALILLRE